MGMKLVAAGDAMLLKDLPFDYRLSEIKKGDARLVNVEMVLSKGKTYASSFCGGQWVYSKQSNLDNLQDYGFNLFACANNHSMDYLFEGLLEMSDFLTEKQVKFAGIG